MADGGWIKVYRSVRKHWLWQNGNERYAKWWIDLLMMVNHEPKKVLVNGKLVVIQTGERLTSIRKLAKQWGSTPRTVNKFLDLLVQDDMIWVEKTRTGGTRVKVLHYAVYQANPHESESGSAPQMTPLPASRPASRVTYKQEPKEPKEPKTKAYRDMGLTPREEFATEIWPSYPRKQGSFSDAQEAYVQAVESGEVTKTQVLAKIDEYKAYIKLNHKGQGFVTTGGNWFTGKQWLSEWDTVTPEKPLEASKGQNRTVTSFREPTDDDFL